MRIGLLGFGVVGRGVYDLTLDRSDINIKYVVCLEDVELPGVTVTRDYQAILADDSVADRTKRIFERVALNGEPPEAVAASFKMKRHAVDQAKSRALTRLREIVKSLEGVANG